MTFRDRLKKLYACNSSVKWVGGRTAPQAWAECERADWMLWILTKMIGKQGWLDRKAVVGLACDCAETALHMVPAGEDRPRIAIETARKWIAGEATADDVIVAADSAYDSTYAAYAAAITAAYAAARAARAAYDAYAACAASAAYAAYGETRAANAAYAAYGAARAVGGGHMRKLADMIRSKVTTVPDVT